MASISAIILPLLFVLCLALRISCFIPGEESIAVVSAEYAAAVRTKLTTPWQVVELETATAADLSAARVIIPNLKWATQPNTTLSQLLSQLPKAQLLQWPITGFDMINFTDVPPRFAICDVHQGGVSISEYVLASLLSWNIQLPETDAAMRQCTWHKGENSCVYPPPHRVAKGLTIGIIGYGSIGVEVAARASAFGMRVIAVTYPVPSVTPAPLAWIGGDDKLPELMSESDFVVAACPLNAATKGMINQAALARMKPSGVLINIARGAVVDEKALYEALSAKSIGGAILDVWWNDFGFLMPGSKAWPSQYNFSALANVRMTPHTSANTHEAHDEQIAQCAENLDALATGAMLHNVVRNASYPLDDTSAEYRQFAV